MGIKPRTVKSSKVQEKEYGSYFQSDLKDYADREAAKKTSRHEVRDRTTEKMWDHVINSFHNIVLVKSKILGRITLK